ncbi:glycosyltransferase family 4 protein [Haloferula rosea]|uniref:Glycosyltransferase n=1 Tax=Haloferula rosea TaxID=490093 RepID=A0A934RFZ0_9BACT|nr:glycosyltransferase [Haloferula rosea]MBK1827811.1 glycosyltransferase [Haloferula rosea]
MKVAIFADIAVDALAGQASGRGGGHAATWLPQLADRFEALEHPFEITWIRTKARRGSDEDVRIGRQRFITLAGFNARIDFLMANLWAAKRFRRVIAELEPDLVHAWGTEKPFGVVPGIFEGPSLLSVQGCLTAFSKVAKLPLHLRVASRLEPLRVRSATRITCESSWSAEQVVKLGVKTMPDVVDYGAHPKFLEAEWTPDPEKPVLLFSGGLERRKGFDLLIDALQLIPDRKWELRVLGDGPLRAEGEAAGLPGITWLGTLPWSRTIPEMKKAWGLVVPTRADTGPTVVKEARVMGLPVIASNHGGLRDYILDGVNGLKVDPLDAPQLASAMTRLMGDFEQVQRLGMSRLQKDRERFDPTLTARSFLRIYGEMLAPSAT